MSCTSPHSGWVRGKASDPEEHATPPPSRQLPHFRFSEPTESVEAPYTALAMTATQSPAPESTYCSRVGRCVAPQRAPARTHGTLCINDQRPGNTGPGPGRKGWLLNRGRTPRAPSPADILVVPTTHMATIDT